MAQATTLSGRLDTPMASAIIVVSAVVFLFGLHKLTVSLH
jgi:hypothetical protein